MAGSLVSMTLTSAPHRRGTPKTNRGISTILKGGFKGGLVDVSAVDTGRRTGSTPWSLGSEAGCELLGDSRDCCGAGHGAAPHAARGQSRRRGGVGRVGRRRVRTLCLAFGGSGYELATYPTNSRTNLRTRGVSRGGVSGYRRADGSRKDSARGSEVRTAGPSLARSHLQPGVPCTRGGGSSFAETMMSGSL
ncbi:hypothetical protein BKH20_03545 [Actinomyces oris]|uniref:Uncharacterized protein n=1 Tax=Actinomyces oris TaxID=544580 RepID=A0A1Q8WU48_9ACTO|nr:hypothetical protein BKH20_03545 [Actinomyces oris]